MANIFDKLYFDAYNFSRLSPRARMVAQLSGFGLGATGVEGVVNTNGGQVGFLAGIGAVAPTFSRDAAMMPMTPQMERLAPLDYNRIVSDTSLATKPIDSPPTSIGVRESPMETVQLRPTTSPINTDPIPEGGAVFAPGTEVDPMSVEAYEGKVESKFWEGEAPRGEAMYLPGEDTLQVQARLPSQPPGTGPATVQMAATSQGIPTWVKVAGGLAGAALLYKLFKRR